MQCTCVCVCVCVSKSQKITKNNQTLNNINRNSKMISVNYPTTWLQLQASAMAGTDADEARGSPIFKNTACRSV